MVEEREEKMQKEVGEECLGSNTNTKKRKYLGSGPGSEDCL